MQSSRKLLEAAGLAARRHAGQTRKGEAGEPYVNHVIEVAHLLAEAGCGDDPVLLIGALLHDTVEDTDTGFDEIAARFGDAVAELVREVTDDKSLSKAARKQAQVDHAPGLSRRAKLLKIADKTSNLRDIVHSPPDWSAARIRDYIDWADKVVAHCRGLNEDLEREFDTVRDKAWGRWGGE